MTPRPSPVGPRRLRQRLLAPLRHEAWLARLAYRLLAYAVVAGANVAGWASVPWVPFVALALTSVAALLAVGYLKPAPDGVAHALVPLPDMGLLYLLLTDAVAPQAWVGLAYLWVAGLAFHTYVRRAALLVPVWGITAYAVLLLVAPAGPAGDVWALAHGLSMGLLILVAHAYVRERTDLRLDGLTGALERRVGLEALEALTYREEPFQLAFVDLRDFKAVNDRHGHGVGDEVLAAVGGRLRNAVRPQDPVLRFGGDEFLVASRNADLAARLERALEGPIVTSAGALELHADVGVDTWRPGDSLEALVRQADASMYAHKRTVVSSAAPRSDPP